MLGANGRAVGSSAWVLGGKHTESGYPILAADSHLETTAPPLLHVSHVRGAEFDVAGAAVPGVPVIWTGHNQRVAWASTSARVATVDLYNETLGESNPSRYHDGRSWRDLEERVEVIGIRGRAEEELTIRSTGHGPPGGYPARRRDGTSVARVGRRPRRHQQRVGLDVESWLGRAMPPN